MEQFNPLQSFWAFVQNGKIINYSGQHLGYTVEEYNKVLDIAKKYEQKHRAKRRPQMNNSGLALLLGIILGNDTMRGWCYDTLRKVSAELKKELKGTANDSRRKDGTAQ